MRKLIIAAVVALALVVATAGIAIAGGGRDDERPITGTALERASAAALAYTGSGRVTETEVGDEEGAYEVEVTLPDGQQVDVHLDASFDVINSKGDDESDAYDDSNDIDD
jgi:uncharacterized membrane protein YkoI